MLLIASLVLVMFAVGGGYYAFATGDSRQARVSAIARPQATGRAMKGAGETQALKRKNVQQLLKDIESKQAEKKEKITLRRRLDQAGLGNTSERMFWICSGSFALLCTMFCFLSGQTLVVTLLVAFATGLGIPRWVLSFMKGRREKAFTNEFANAIDVIVRSVR